MKKFLALMIAVVIAFSMVAVPVNATETNVDIEKVETTVNEAFTFAENLANAIHKLVGDILAVFGKECPFCDEIHELTTEAPEEDTTGTTQPEEDTTVTEPTQPEEDTTGTETPVIPEVVYPTVPANFPAKPVIPEDAIRVDSVDGIADAIANAASGAYIVLADGVYDEITLTKGNITLAAENATVGFINLNGKSNITLDGITFDAAGAKAALRGDAASTGFVASIVATLSGAKVANGHNIVIKNCTFTGTPAEGANYVPVYVNDHKRTSYHAYNYTVDGCLFEAKSSYYVYLSYLVEGNINIKNNFFGNKDLTCTGILWSSSNGSNVTFENNTAFNWTGSAIGGSRSGAAYAIEVQVRHNTFVQVAEGANTDYVYLKSYKEKDTFDVVNSLNSFVGTISASNANVYYEALA